MKHHMENVKCSLTKGFLLAQTIHISLHWSFPLLLLSSIWKWVLKDVYLCKSSLLGLFCFTHGTNILQKERQREGGEERRKEEGRRERTKIECSDTEGRANVRNEQQCQWQEKCVPSLLSQFPAVWVSTLASRALQYGTVYFSVFIKWSFRMDITRTSRMEDTICAKNFVWKRLKGDGKEIKYDRVNLLCVSHSVVKRAPYYSFGTLNDFIQMARLESLSILIH